MHAEPTRIAAINLLCCSVLLQAQTAPPAIPFEEVKKHVGETVTVCGRVVSHGCEEDRAITLDLNQPYWKNDSVALLITTNARSAFPSRLEDHYLLAPLCATGLVEHRKRRIVVRVDRPEQLRLGERPQIATFAPDAVRSCDPGVQMPVPIRTERPVYTDKAARARQEGRVLLDIVVLPDGGVGDVRVVVGLRPDLGLADAGVKAVRRWRFKPGTLNGQIVPVVVGVELTFTMV